MSNIATHGFQTEVKQILNLMINSLYSNKEIFVRELVSNSADAADKLRYLALKDGDIYGDDANLRVRVSFDKEAKTITISDNGIGMNPDEVMNNLGTIAKSGTAEFFNNLSGDSAKDSQLIGQFGVGFYSAFIVAEKVVVETRHAKDGKDTATRWISAGEGEFSIETISKETRGTDITLHLKAEETEFLNDYRLRSLITKYSDHISIPVEFYSEAVEEQKNDKGEVTTEAKPAEWKAVNKANALWMRNKNDITQEEYNEFYKSVANDYLDPLKHSHNRVEGKQEYTSLLYIPKKAPWDLQHRDKKHGIKLYVQRVFIMDDADTFMPSYLRFVKGLLDSNDLPLNVSREILQDNKISRSLKAALTKRTLSMLSGMAKNNPEDYQIFWQEFGNVIKEGPAEDYENAEKIAGLLRFASTHNDSDAQTVSLDDYIERKKENQKKIYYIVADSYLAAKNSPHLEILNKKGVEVLLMSERIDEWMMNYLSKYKDIEFQSITKGDLELGELESKDEKEKQEKLTEDSKSLIERFQSVIGDDVKEIRVTTRLTDSPACLVSAGDEMSSQMIKLMETAGQKVPETKGVLEINPEHEIIKNLDQEQDENKFKEWAQLLLAQAQLSERGSLKDPSTFIKSLNKIWMSSLGQ